MKRAFALIVSLLLLASCSSGSSDDSKARSQLVKRYESWLERESFYIFGENLPHFPRTGGDVPCDPQDVYQWVEDHVEYEYEGSDYWKSSQETFDSMSGDCEDKAILFYVLLIQNSYPVNYVDLFIVKIIWPERTSTYHAVLGVYSEVNEQALFTNADNITAYDSALLMPGVKNELFCGFNADEMWFY